MKLQLPLASTLEDQPPDTQDVLDRMTARTIESSKELIAHVKQMQVDADERVERWLTRTEKFIDKMKDG